MLTENQAKWLAALRSGEYAQGNGTLRRENRFCCLGVAAELFKTETTKVEMEGDPAMYIYDDRSGSAPAYVIEALNLNDCYGAPRDRTGVLSGSLAWYNDNGYTFTDIADMFEAQLERFTKGS